MLTHELYVAPFGRAMLTSLNWIGEVEVCAPELAQAYEFCSVHRDSADITIGSDSCDFSPAAGVVLSPHRPFRVCSEGYCSLNFTIPQTLMQTHVQALIGQELKEPLEFNPAIDFRDRSMASLLRMVRSLAEEIEYDRSLLTNPLIAERYCETLLTGFAFAQPHNYSHLMHRAVTGAEPKYIRRVEEYLEAHCDQPITSEAVAAVAGISASALYEGFKRHRGYTPLEFLKDVRLRRVRDELLAARPGTTVKTTAMRWGFNHLGRFSKAYSRRFGETPSQTLKR